MKQWTVMQVCSNCKAEYGATHVQYAIEIDASQGLCPACFLARARKTITVNCQDCHRPFVTTYFGYKGALGDKDLKLFVSDVCPDCSQLRELAQATKRAAEVAAKRRKWREASGIPEHFLLKGFETFEIYPHDNNLGKIFNVCQNYAETFPIGYRKYVRQNGRAFPSLLLFGGNGRGKSHLACSIAHRILNRWQGEPEVYSNPIQFISEPELLARIKETYSFSPEERIMRESETDIVNYLISCDLLIVDDVGKDPKPDMTFVRRILFRIINGRWKADRPVIVTTNFDAAGLKQYLGKDTEDNAVFGRLVQMTDGAFYELEGFDYRLKT